VRAGGPQGAVAAVQVAVFAPGEGFQQGDAGAGGAGQFAVQVVDVAGGFGDHPADDVEGVARRALPGQGPGVVDAELLGHQVRAGPLGGVVGVHPVASSRARSERTRVGRPSGPLPVRTWSDASSRTYAASSRRALEISMQASVIVEAASRDAESTSM